LFYRVGHGLKLVGQLPQSFFCFVANEMLGPAMRPRRLFPQLGWRRRAVVAVSHPMVAGGAGSDAIQRPARGT
jgi:hypothetical protein